MKTSTQDSYSGAYLTCTEAAEKFGYTSDYIAKLAREDKVRAERVDRQWFIEPASLVLFVEQSEQDRQEMRRRLRQERRLELAQRQSQVTLGPDMNLSAVSATAVWPSLWRSSTICLVGALVGYLLFSWFSVGADLTDLRAGAGLVAGQMAIAGKAAWDNSWGEVLDREAVSQIGAVGQVESIIPVTENNPAVGLAISKPSSGIMFAETVREQFSDPVEVELLPDGSGRITPQFVSGPGQSYEFVVVPVRGVVD